MSSRDFPFNFSVENMVNVPKISGVYNIRWKVLLDGKLINKSKLSNQLVKNFKVNWAEIVKIDISRHVQGKVDMEFIICEVEEGESKTVGTAKLTLFIQDHPASAESWAVLVENSKMNASLRILTWFGEQEPELKKVDKSGPDFERRRVLLREDTSDSDYSCSSNEYKENKRIIDDIFQ